MTMTIISWKPSSISGRLVKAVSKVWKRPHSPNRPASSSGCMLLCLQQNKASTLVYIMCQLLSLSLVCIYIYIYIKYNFHLFHHLFSALSRRVGALQISLLVSQSIPSYTHCAVQTTHDKNDVHTAHSDIYTVHAYTQYTDIYTVQHDMYTEQ